jgi:predicted nicotinamide N-methyase
VSSNPLCSSLAEQLGRLRGGGPLPDSLLDVVSEHVQGLMIIRPRDWDELRHQEGGAGRGVPYWARLWPSGLALAEELARRDDLAGMRTLELGCGLGAPSVVAAHRGAQVLAADSAPEAVVFAAHNLALNDLEGDVAQLDWNHAEALAAGAPWELVIAADVLYLRHNVEALARLLPVLVGEAGEALIADPRRAGGRDFLAAARGRFRLDTHEPPGHDGVAIHRLRPRFRTPGRPWEYTKITRPDDAGSHLPTTTRAGPGAMLHP